MKYPKISEALKGKSRTKAAKDNLRLKAIERLKDKTRHPLYGRHHSEETKRKLSIKASTPERIHISISNLPQYKPREGPYHGYFLGKHHTEQTKHKIRIIHLGSHQKQLIKFINTLKCRIRKLTQRQLGLHSSYPYWLHSPEIREKTRKSMKGKTFTESHRLNLGESNRKRAQNETLEQKSKRVRRTIEASWKRPTSLEIKLEEIINIACPNEYKYTGNGSFIIGGSNPDFVNCNGQKKVIEGFGDYWHQGQNIQDKISKYAGFGFDCLVIWEHDLYGKSEKELVSIIKSFNYGEGQ